eukprot:Gregarina_sp_Poly_1__3214@NODE_1915_length_3091_cov_40_863757_g1236_i0_p1_GENE_NODE_1915_length_3091_cov_40_863757_g1236_i0NODE_1915_length_3091_cov_40_863757_g1236_i0_p1_ORF_typecomplete_len504_score75_82_NODE_1915_length_3091_cov_40_863757_g1236_i013582869
MDRERQHLYSRDGVRLLGSPPKHRLPVISKASGGIDEYNPLVLQDGWHERRLEPSWQAQEEKRKLAEALKIAGDARKKSQPPHRHECEEHRSIGDPEEQRALKAAQLARAGLVPQRQRLDLYSKSGFTEFKHLLFNKDRLPPFAVDNDETDDGSFINKHGERIRAFQTTNDIAYNFDNKFKDAKPAFGTGTNKFSHLDYQDDADRHLSTQHKYLRAVAWLPPEVLSKNKKFVEDDLADPWRPALVKNRFGLNSYHVGTQTDACFMYQWKQLEWPMDDFRGLNVDLESKPCPEGVRKVLPLHGQHGDLEFANCDDCQIRAACKREADRKKQPARRNNNEPNVLLPETGCVLETETPNLCCDCLDRDIHCTDLDFGLTPSRPPNDEWLKMHRGRAERETLRRTKATQTPGDKEMSDYWLEAEARNEKEILLSGDEQLRQKWEASKRGIDTKGQTFEVAYYLRPYIKKDPKPQPYRRRVHGDIAPPTDGWSGYIHGPRISDSEMSS